MVHQLEIRCLAGLLMPDLLYLFSSFYRCFDCKFDCFDIFFFYYEAIVVEFCRDAYKEFEKEIQEDLQEVDDRLEEEEVTAFSDYFFLTFLLVWKNLKRGNVILYGIR